MAEWVAGMPCRVVEHDEATRQAKPGGEVFAGTVVKAGKTYVRARVDEGRLMGRSASFWAETGWTAWDGEFRWRLLPGTGEETGQ